MFILLHGLMIGFLGVGMYLSVDQYEPNRKLAGILKWLVVSIGILAFLAHLPV
jgi:hypothetical protein